MASKDANGPSGRGRAGKGKEVNSKQRKLTTKRRGIDGGKKVKV